MRGTTEFVYGDAHYRMWNSPDKIGRAFREGKLYERPLLEWIREQRFKGIAVDVGANIGNHTLWMAAVCGLKVIAFEPVMPHVVRANVALNPHLHSRVQVFEYGLGSAEGEFHHTGKGVLRPGLSDQTTDEIAAVYPMDKLVPHEGVAFIKIDVEGMEVDVLKGSQKVLQTSHPALAIEEWESQTTKAVQAILSPLGYARGTVFGGRGRAPMAIWRVP